MTRVCFSTEISNNQQTREVDGDGKIRRRVFLYIRATEERRLIPRARFARVCIWGYERVDGWRLMSWRKRVTRYAISDCVHNRKARGLVFPIYHTGRYHWAQITIQTHLPWLAMIRYYRTVRICLWPRGDLCGETGKVGKMMYVKVSVIQCRSSYGWEAEEEVVVVILLTIGT